MTDLPAEGVSICELIRRIGRLTSRFRTSFSLAFEFNYIAIDLLKIQYRFLKYFGNLTPLLS